MNEWYKHLLDDSIIKYTKCFVFSLICSNFAPRFTKQTTITIRHL